MATLRHLGLCQRAGSALKKGSLCRLRSCQWHVIHPSRKISALAAHLTAADGGTRESTGRRNTLAVSQGLVQSMTACTSPTLQGGKVAHVQGRHLKGRMKA